MCIRPRVRDDGSRAHASPYRDRFSGLLLGAFFRSGDGALCAEKPPDSTPAGATSLPRRFPADLSRQPAPRAQRPLARRHDGQRATGHTLPRSHLGRSAHHPSASLDRGARHFCARRAPLRSHSKIARPFDGLPDLGAGRFHPQTDDAAARSRRASARKRQHARDRSAHPGEIAGPAADQRRGAGDARRDGRGRGHAAGGGGRDDPGNHQAGRQDGEGLHDAAGRHLRGAG